MSAVAKTNPLLTAYLRQLSTHPLRTKSITAGILCFIQEILGSHLAGTPGQRPPKEAPYVAHLLARAKVDTKALKMALYGFLVSAPLGHFLVGNLQRIFAGKTGTGAKIAQIIASNLLIAPIQATVYLSSVAIINGAKTGTEVVRTVKAGFMSVMRITWTTSPLSMVIAQKFVPLELWVPFFNAISFVLGTYFTVRVKRMRMLAEAKAKKEKDNDEDQL